MTVGHVVSGNNNELNPLQLGVVLVVSGFSSPVGSFSVNNLVGDNWVTAHVRSNATDEVYSSVVV